MLTLAAVVLTSVALVMLASREPVRLVASTQTPVASAAPSVVPSVAATIGATVRTSVPSTPEPTPDVGTSSADTKALTADINAWGNAAAQNGSWLFDTYGDEMLLARTECGARNFSLGCGIGISLDTRIPAPLCSVGTTASAAGVASWIEGNPWLSVAPERRAIIEGIEALELDVQLRSADSLTLPNCDGGSLGPDRGVFIEIHEREGRRHPWNIAPDQTIRLYLFDRFARSSAPRTVVVTIGSSRASLESAITDAMPVVRELFAKFAAYSD